MKIKILWKDRKYLGVLVLGLGGVVIYSLCIPLNTILKARAVPGAPPEDWTSASTGSLGEEARIQGTAETVRVLSLTLCALQGLQARTQCRREPDGALVLTEGPADPVILLQGWGGIA